MSRDSDTERPPPDLHTVCAEHSHRIQRVEKCVTKTATELEAIDGHLTELRAARKWAIGLAVTILLSVGGGAVGVVVTVGALEERVSSTSATLDSVEEEQEQHGDLLRSIGEGVIKVSSDGENQRASNRRAIERLERALDRHESMRGAHR
jgi:hypothetical protein